MSNTIFYCNEEPGNSVEFNYGTLQKKIMPLLFVLICWMPNAQNVYDISIKDANQNSYDYFVKDTTCPCGEYAYIQFRVDTSSVKIMCPKKYLDECDSVRLLIKNNNSSDNFNSYCFFLRVNGYALSKFIEGVTVYNLPRIYCISVQFNGSHDIHKDDIENSISFDTYDNYAYTGGFWPFWGLRYDFTYDNGFKKYPTTVKYKVYSTTGICYAENAYHLMDSIILHYDKDGKCVRKEKSGYTISYEYNKKGGLQKEKHFQSDSLIAILLYKHYLKKTVTRLYLTGMDDVFSLKTIRHSSSITETCYNDVAAVLWSRETFYHKNNKNRIITMLNKKKTMKYCKEYDNNDNIISEFFENSNHKIIYNYTSFDRGGKWTEVSVYSCYDGLILPIYMITREMH